MSCLIVSFSVTCSGLRLERQNIERLYFLRFQYYYSINKHNDRTDHLQFLINFCILGNSNFALTQKIVAQHEKIQDPFFVILDRKQ